MKLGGEGHPEPYALCRLQTKPIDAVPANTVPSTPVIGDANQDDLCRHVTAHATTPFSGTVNNTHGNQTSAPPKKDTASTATSRSTGALPVPAIRPGNLTPAKDHRLALKLFLPSRSAIVEIFRVRELLELPAPVRPVLPAKGRRPGVPIAITVGAAAFHQH